MVTLPSSQFGFVSWNACSCSGANIPSQYIASVNVYPTIGFPTFIPPDVVAIAIDTVNGTQYQWYSGAWH
jgi:hypothetical protein